MSTVIWSPTKKLPHPLAQIEGSEAMDQGMTNILSYALIEETIWNTPAKDLSDFIQSGSPPIYFMVREHTMETPGMLARAIQDTVVKRGLRAILSQDCRDICRILNHNDVFLVDNIPHEFCLRADIQESTRVVQRQVHDESGLKSAIQAFYRWLPPQVQKCDITNQNLAMYQIWNKPSSKISPEAAAVLLEERLIKQTDIVL
ncbi:hypothetical protein APSETT444_007775 [Aspergillus pseudonomiae]